MKYWTNKYLKIKVNPLSNEGVKRGNNSGNINARVFPHMVWVTISNIYLKLEVTEDISEIKKL
jgi:hypothetical protein